MILDATCSERRRWPKHADIRADINPGAHPDVLTDARRLPFRDATFDYVYCDPPHNILLSKNPKWLSEHAGGLARPGYARYSGWRSKAEWLEFLDRVNSEFSRVLRPGGRLIFKCPDGSRSHGGSIRFGDLQRLTAFGIIADFQGAQRGPFATLNRKMGKTVGRVHYVTFAKRS